MVKKLFKRIIIPQTEEYGWRSVWNENISLNLLDGYYSGYELIFDPTEQEMENRLNFIKERVSG